MPKHTPKTAPLTRAGQDLRERQALAARGSKGGWKRPERVSLAAKAAARELVPEQDQGVTTQTCELAQNRKLTRNACLTSVSAPQVREEKGSGESFATGSETRPDLTTAPRFTFPPPAEPAPAPPSPAIGAYRIDQLRLGQCRFACTPHGAREHRFCGAATEIGPGNLYGSWCAEHLPVVQSSGGAGWKSKAEVAAQMAAKGEVA